MEDRLAPAVIAWDGGPTGTGTEWTVAANWSGDVLPGSNDEAQIGAAFSSIAITHNSGTSTIQKVTSEAAVTITGGTLALSNSTSTFNKTLTVANGGTLELRSATINGGIAVQGTLLARGGSGIGGSVTTAASSVIRMQGDGSFGTGTLIVANGFTNLGLIELTADASGNGATLFVSAGTLVNDASATIKSLVGGSSGGRTINGDIHNNGLIDVQQSLIVSGGSLTNLVGASIELKNSALNGTLINQGKLTVRNGNSALNSGVTTAATSIIRLDGGGSGSAVLTVANGLDNKGSIELTNSGFDANFTVNGGALINESGAFIKSLVGLTGSHRLNAELNNQGTLTVDGALTISQASAKHINSGTIDVNADLTVTQSGVSPSFTEAGGAITIAVGKTLAISDNNGIFNFTAGTIGGPGTLSLSSTIANFTPDFSNAVTGLKLDHSTLNGPGLLTNASAMNLLGSTINASLINQGKLTVRNGNSALNSGVTTAATSIIRLDGGGSGSAILTVANGLDNKGSIELTNSGFDASLTVNGGALINESGAFIKSLLGLTGSHSLNAKVDNQGTIQVDNSLLTISNLGSLANFAGSILTGGSYVLTGTLRFPGADISTNAATITLNGPNAKIQETTNLTDAFAKFGTNSNGGSLTLTGNVTFATSGDLSNAGILVVDAGSKLALGAKSLNQTGGVSTFNGTLTASNINLISGTLTGFGTVKANIANSGGVTTPTASATLTIDGDYSQSATGQSKVPTGSSLITINNGKFDQSGGTTTVDGTLDSATVFNLFGGQLSGTGTIAADVNNSGGTVAPGPVTGVLTITGNYSQFTGGTFSAEINGVLPGAQHDQLVVQGSTTLGGSLLTSFGSVAKVSDSFVVLNNQGVGALNGTFADIPNGEFFLNGLHFRADYAGGDGNDLVLTRLSTNVSVAIDDGTVQRSRIRSITLTFGGIVSIPADPSIAIALNRTGPDVNTGPVTLILDTSASSASQTIAKLTFTGSMATFGSLIDGHYDLSIHGEFLTDLGGQSVDADNDGFVGGNTERQFHRLFGDADGNAAVTASDFNTFRRNFGVSGLSIFDADGDNQVNMSDFSQFLSRYGVTI